MRRLSEIERDLKGAEAIANNATGLMMRRVAADRVSRLMRERAEIQAYAQGTRHDPAD